MRFEIMKKKIQKIVTNELTQLPRNNAMANKRLFNIMTDGDYNVRLRLKNGV